MLIPMLKTIPEEIESKTAFLAYARGHEECCKGLALTIQGLWWPWSRITAEALLYPELIKARFKSWLPRRYLPVARPDVSWVHVFWYTWNAMADSVRTFRRAWDARQIYYYYMYAYLISNNATVTQQVSLAGWAIYNSRATTRIKADTHWPNKLIKKNKITHIYKLTCRDVDGGLPILRYCM